MNWITRKLMSDDEIFRNGYDKAIPPPAEYPPAPPPVVVDPSAYAMGQVAAFIGLVILLGNHEIAWWGSLLWWLWKSKKKNTDDRVPYFAYTIAAGLGTRLLISLYFG